MPEAADDKKQRVAGVFGRSAETYDRVGPSMFVPVGRRLVALAQLPAGATVLDVATGRGAVLFAAAEQVGPQGRVIGIDLAEAMVQETATDIRRQGLANAAVRPMDAEQDEFRLEPLGEPDDGEDELREWRRCEDEKEWWPIDEDAQLFPDDWSYPEPPEIESATLEDAEREHN